MRNELGNTLVIDATVGDLAVGELFVGQARALHCLTGAWGRVNLQAPLSATVGV